MAHMKSWHIVVLEGGHKVVKDVVKYSAADARELEKELKDNYAEINAKNLEADPKAKLFSVKREWY